MRTDMHSNEKKTKTTEIASNMVRKCQRRPRKQSSPVGHETATAKDSKRWKHVSVDGNDVYILQNVSIEALEPSSSSVLVARVPMRRRRRRQ